MLGVGGAVTFEQGPNGSPGLARGGAPVDGGDREKIDSQKPALSLYMHKSSPKILFSAFSTGAP